MAIDILGKKDIDIVLMDVDMPELDGIETVRIIRGMEKVNDVPVVFFTALASKEVVARCKEVGMKGYVLKPYRPEELIDTIKAVINFALPRCPDMYETALQAPALTPIT